MNTSSNKTMLPETAKKILQSQFRGEKTKISDDVVQLVIEIINAGVTESVLRAGKQAKMEGSETIQVEHVEKVLPQLILDL